MPGLSLHIGTLGHYAPGSNAGSNPLAIGSHYHRLGPSLGIFSLRLAPDTGAADFDTLFLEGNALRTTISSTKLQVVNAGITIGNPYDLRLTIGGVSYKIPEAEAKQINGPNGGIVYWRASTGSGFFDEGSFRFYRKPPPVFPE